MAIQDSRCKLDLPKGRRRVEFEVNTDDRHVCQLRAVAFGKQGGMVKVRFKGNITLRDGDGGLQAVGRDNRFLPIPVLAEDVTMWGKLRFRVIGAVLSRLDGG